MKVDWRDRLFTTLAIMLVLGLTLGLMRLLGPVFERIQERLYGVSVVVVAILLFGLLTATYLRLLVRIYPFREGTYPMDHPQFTLWKHCTVVGDLARTALSPLNLAMTRVLYYRILGARVGRSVAIGRANFTDPLLTTLEDLSVIGDGATLGAHTLVFDRFVIKRVAIRKGATVGAHCALAPGADVGQNSVVAALSLVSLDTVIPPNEYWQGIPAQKVKDIRLSRQKVREDAGQAP